MPTTSVLVLTHDRDEHLLRQADSLQHTQGCDGAAGRGWDEVVVTFVNQDTEPWEFPPDGVRTQHLEAEGLALAAGRNASARAARAQDEDVLVFLDVDCLAEPTTVATLAADCRPGRLVMASPCYLPPGWAPPSDPSLVAIPHPSREGLGTGASTDWHMFWSLGFAITAGDFWCVGGFDEDYRGYGGEDTDFAFRCRDAGMNFFLSPARVLHQAHAVHRPPLHHFASIVTNARRFHQRWGRWPMVGWLDAFAARGLLRIDGDELVVLREPTADEVAATHQPTARF
ncbi:glycosyltransferase family 2 protein [Luteococcus sediminum]